MNQSTKPLGKRSSWNRPSTYLGGLFIVLLAAIGGFVLHELIAHRQYSSRLEQLRLNGIPTDTAEIEAQFNKVLNAESSIPWHEVGFLELGWVSSMCQDLLDNRSAILAPTYIEGDWPEGQRIGELLEQVQPFILRLHEIADKTDDPVLQPIHRIGYRRLGIFDEESHSIIRLLLLDYDYAIYAKDQQRALRDLKTLLAVCKAYHWDFYNYYCLENNLYHAVGKILKSPMWTMDGLVQLRQLFDQPIDVNSQWNRMVSSVLLYKLASLEVYEETTLNSSKFRGIDRLVYLMAAWLPSSRLKLLDEFEAYASIGNSSLENIAHTASKVDAETSHGILSTDSSLLVLASRQFVQLEETRRMLQTAVALKQYKLSQGEFPKRLEELLEDSTLGLSRTEIMGVDRKLFPYLCIDPQSAAIWNIRQDNGTPLGDFVGEMLDHYSVIQLN